MIEIVKSDKNYNECNSCTSTYDVKFLKFSISKNDNTVSIKLCANCRCDLIDEIMNSDNT